MLTTDDLALDNYVFKSSPESCSDHSYSTDYMDVTSDEDFLTQLSSDLDIPLLLNQGEDELSMFNSLFFDKSPDEILSETASPPYVREEDFSKEISDLQRMDFSKCGPEAYPNLKEVKNEPSDGSISPHSSKSVSPIFTDQNVKEETISLSPPASPVIINTVNEIPSNVIYAQPVKLLPSAQNLPQKHIPIVPKNQYSLPINKNNLVVLNRDLKPVVTQSHNVVLLENVKVNTVPQLSVSTVPVSTVTTVSSLKSVAVPSVVIDRSTGFSLNGRNIDPKIFKRQQRKIKNRESASLSRKKKKDYVTSLEEQVKELTSENQRLQAENAQLKDKLAQIQVNPFSYSGNKAVKPSIFLCICLLVIGVNLNVVRNPFSTKSQVDLLHSIPRLNDHHGRGLLWAAEDSDVKENKTSSFSPFFMCPATINQTESARLVLELERWIGKPANLSEKVSLETNKTSDTPKKVRPRKKKYRLDSSLTSFRRHRYKNEQDDESSPKNEIQVFSVRPEQVYSEFFEAINRQDDTFYVVSFTDQHMLLPALHHNKTRRPKMSLIMPSIMPNGTVSKTSLISLMQIDCEVTDTRLINVKHGAIPQHFRMYSNTTKKEPSESDVTDSNTTKTDYYKSNYKPYFMKSYDRFFKLN